MPVILLVLFASAIFVIVNQVQKQNQDVRSRASGLYPTTKVTPTPTKKTISSTPTSAKGQGIGSRCGPGYGDCAEGQCLMLGGANFTICQKVTAPETTTPTITSPTGTVKQTITPTPTGKKQYEECSFGGCAPPLTCQYVNGYGKSMCLLPPPTTTITQTPAAGGGLGGPCLSGATCNIPYVCRSGTCQAASTPTPLPPTPTPTGQECYNGWGGQGGPFNDCNGKCGGQENVVKDPSTEKTYCKAPAPTPTKTPTPTSTVTSTVKPTGSTTPTQKPTPTPTRASGELCQTWTGNDCTRCQCGYTSYPSGFGWCNTCSTPTPTVTTTPATTLTPTEKTNLPVGARCGRTFGTCAPPNQCLGIPGTGGTQYSCQVPTVIPTQNPVCRHSGATCGGSYDCCANESLTCDSTHTCVKRKASGSCTQDSDCASGQCLADPESGGFFCNVIVPSATPTTKPPKAGEKCAGPGITNVCDKCPNGYHVDAVGSSCNAAPTPTETPHGEYCYDGLDGSGGLGEQCSGKCGGAGPPNVYTAPDGQTYCAPGYPTPTPGLAPGCVCAETLGYNPDPAKWKCGPPSAGTGQQCKSPPAVCCATTPVSPTPTTTITPTPTPQYGQGCYNGIDGNGGFGNNCNERCGGQQNVIRDPYGNTYCKPITPTPTPTITPTKTPTITPTSTRAPTLTPTPLVPTVTAAPRVPLPSGPYTCPNAPGLPPSHGGEIVGGPGSRVYECDGSTGRWVDRTKDGYGWKDLTGDKGGLASDSATARAMDQQALAPTPDPSHPPKQSCSNNYNGTTSEIPDGAVAIGPIQDGSNRWKCNNGRWEQCPGCMLTIIPDYLRNDPAFKKELDAYNKAVSDASTLYGKTYQDCIDAKKTVAECKTTAQKALDDAKLPQQVKDAAVQSYTFNTVLQDQYYPLLEKYNLCMQQHNNDFQACAGIYHDLNKLAADQGMSLDYKNQIDTEGYNSYLQNKLVNAYLAAQSAYDQCVAEKQSNCVDASSQVLNYPGITPEMKKTIAAIGVLHKDYFKSNSELCAGKGSSCNPDAIRAAILAAATDVPQDYKDYFAQAYIAQINAVAQKGGVGDVVGMCMQLAQTQADRDRCTTDFAFAQSTVLAHTTPEARQAAQQHMDELRTQRIDTVAQTGLPGDISALCQELATTAADKSKCTTDPTFAQTTVLAKASPTARTAAQKHFDDLAVLNLALGTNNDQQIMDYAKTHNLSCTDAVSCRTALVGLLPPEWRSTTPPPGMENIAAALQQVQAGTQSNYYKAYQQYVKDHGPTTLEAFNKVQQDAYDRIASTLKNMGALEAFQAKWQRGEVLPTDMEKTINDLEKDPLAWLQIQVNNLTGGAVIKNNIYTKDIYAGARAQLLYTALDDLTRQRYLTSLSQTDAYIKWHADNPTKKPEDYLIVQLTAAVANEDNFLTAGVTRKDNLDQFYGQVMRGELDAVSAANAIQNMGGVEKAALTVFNVANSLSGGAAGRTFVQNANPNIEQSQGLWAATVEINDIKYSNPDLYKQLNLDDPAVRTKVQNQYASALYIEDHAKDGAVPGMDQLVAADPSWLRKAALTGSLDVDALKQQIAQTVELNTQLSNTTDPAKKTEILDQLAKAKTQATQALINAYMSGLDPATKATLDTDLAHNRPDLKPADYDAYRREQLAALLTDNSSDLQMLMTAGGQKMPSMQDILSGKANYTGALEILKNAGPIEQIALGLNRLENGALLKGQLLVSDPKSNTWDKFRGSVMMTAKPVTWVLMIVPGGQVLSLGSSALTTATMVELGSTILGMQFTADGLTQTMDVCSFRADMDRNACAMSAGMTAFAAASTIPGLNGLGSLARNAQALRAGAEVANLYAAGASELEIQTAMQTAERLSAGAAAAQTSRYAQILSNQLTQRGIAGLGALVFGSQAVDTCRKEGPSASCVITAGLAAVSAARVFVNPAIASDVQQGVGKTIHTADKIVNSALAAQACLSALQGNGDPGQCTTTLFMASLAFREPKAGGTTGGQEDVYSAQERSIEELRKLSQAADGVEVTINGTKYTVTPENRPTLLVQAKAQISSAIIAVGLTKPSVDDAMKTLKGKPEELLPSERLLSEAQKEWEKISNDPASTPAQKDEAQRSLLAAKQSADAEAALLKPPRLISDRIFDGIAARLGIKNPLATAHIELEKAQSDFNALRGKDITDPAYKPALDRLVAAQDAVTQLSYNNVQAAYANELKAKEDSLKTLRDEARALQDEITKTTDPQIKATLEKQLVDKLTQIATGNSEAQNLQLKIQSSGGLRNGIDILFGRGGAVQARAEALIAKLTQTAIVESEIPKSQSERRLSVVGNDQKTLAEAIRTGQITIENGRFVVTDGAPPEVAKLVSDVHAAPEQLADTVRAIQFEATRSDYQGGRITVQPVDGRVAFVAEPGVSSDVKAMVESINNDLRKVEQLLSTEDKPITIRGSEAKEKDQMRVIADALFTGNQESIGRLYESITGSGKSTLMIPLIAELKSKYSGRDVIIILPSEENITQMFEKFPPEVFKELGIDVFRYNQSTDVNGADFQNAHIIVTTKDVIFDSIRSGVSADTVMSRVRGAVLVADEAQLTLRLETDYNVTDGPQKKITEMANGQHLIDVFEEVHKATTEFRARAATEKGLVVLRDGRGIVTDQEALRQMYRTLAGDSLPAIEELVATKNLTFEQALDAYLQTTNADPAIAARQQAVREKIAAFNSITKVLADVPETGFGIDKDGRVVPHDGGVNTGRRYSNAMDAMAYESIGKERLGNAGDINLSEVTVSEHGVSTNYAEFLQNFHEIYGFSGTPDLLRQQFAQVYGVSLSVSPVNQSRFVFGDYNPTTGVYTGAEHPIASITTAHGPSDILISAPRSGTAHNIVITDPGIASSEIVDQVRAQHPNTDVVVLDPNGKFTIYGPSGERTFATLEETEAYVKQNYYGASPPKEFIRVFKYGTHYGTDTYHLSTDTWTTIAGTTTDRTTFLQGIGRDRGTFGYAPDTNVIVLGDQLPAGPMSQQDLITMLNTNEARVTRQIELDGITRVVDNKVVEFIRQLQTADTAAGTGKGTSYYQGLIDGWRQRAELDYSVGTGDSRGIDVLTEKFKRAQEYILSLDRTLPATGPVRDAYNTIRGGGTAIDSLALRPGTGISESFPSGFKPFNDATSLIDLKKSVEMVVGTDDIPATIARGVDRAGTEYVAATKPTTTGPSSVLDAIGKGVSNLLNPQPAAGTVAPVEPQVESSTPSRNLATALAGLTATKRTVGQSLQQMPTDYSKIPGVRADLERQFGIISTSPVDTTAALAPAELDAARKLSLQSQNMNDLTRRIIDSWNTRDSTDYFAKPSEVAIAKALAVKVYEEAAQQQQAVANAQKQVDTLTQEARLDVASRINQKAPQLNIANAAPDKLPEAARQQGAVLDAVVAYETAAIAAETDTTAQAQAVAASTKQAAIASIDALRTSLPQVSNSAAAKTSEQILGDITASVLTPAAPKAPNAAAVTAGKAATNNSIRSRIASWFTARAKSLATATVGLRSYISNHLPKSPVIVNWFAGIRKNSPQAFAKIGTWFNGVKMSGLQAFLKIAMWYNGVRENNKGIGSVTTWLKNIFTIQPDPETTKWDEWRKNGNLFARAMDWLTIRDSEKILPRIGRYLVNVTPLGLGTTGRRSVIGFIENCADTLVYVATRSFIAPYLYDGLRVIRFWAMHPQAVIPIGLRLGLVYGLTYVIWGLFLGGGWWTFATYATFLLFFTVFPPTVLPAAARPVTAVTQPAAVSPQGITQPATPASVADRYFVFLPENITEPKAGLAVTYTYRGGVFAGKLNQKFDNGVWSVNGANRVTFYVSADHMKPFGSTLPVPALDITDIPAGELTVGTKVRFKFDAKTTVEGVITAIARGGVYTVKYAYPGTGRDATADKTGNDLTIVSYAVRQNMGELFDAIIFATREKLISTAADQLQSGKSEAEVRGNIAWMILAVTGKIPGIYPAEQLSLLPAEVDSIIAAAKNKPAAPPPAAAVPPVAPVNPNPPAQPAEPVVAPVVEQPAQPAAPAVPVVAPVVGQPATPAVPVVAPVVEEKVATEITLDTTAKQNPMADEQVYVLDPGKISSKAEVYIGTNDKTLASRKGYVNNTFVIADDPALNGKQIRLYRSGNAWRITKWWAIDDPWLKVNGQDVGKGAIELLSGTHTIVANDKTAFVLTIDENGVVRIYKTTPEKAQAKAIEIPPPKPLTFEQKINRHLGKAGFTQVYKDAYLSALTQLAVAKTIPEQQAILGSMATIQATIKKTGVPPSLGTQTAIDEIQRTIIVQMFMNAVDAIKGTGINTANIIQFGKAMTDAVKEFAPLIGEEIAKATDVTFLNNLKNTLTISVLPAYSTFQKAQDIQNLIAAVQARIDALNTPPAVQPTSVAPLYRVTSALHNQMITELGALSDAQQYAYISDRFGTKAADAYKSKQSQTTGENRVLLALREAEKTRFGFYIGQSQTLTISGAQKNTNIISISDTRNVSLEQGTSVAYATVSDFPNDRILGNNQRTALQEKLKTNPNDKRTLSDILDETPTGTINAILVAAGQKTIPLDPEINALQQAYDAQKAAPAVSTAAPASEQLAASVAYVRTHPQGTISYKDLHPHEVGYYGPSYDQIRKSIEQGEPMPPVKVVIVKNPDGTESVYTVDGATRVAAYRDLGMDVPYVLSTNPDDVSLIDFARKAYASQLPSSYDASVFTINPNASRDNPATITLTLGGNTTIQITVNTSQVTLYNTQGTVVFQGIISSSGDLLGYVKQGAVSLTIGKLTNIPILNSRVSQLGQQDIILAPVVQSAPAAQPAAPIVEQKASAPFVQEVAQVVVEEVQAESPTTPVEHAVDIAAAAIPPVDLGLKATRVVRAGQAVNDDFAPPDNDQQIAEKRKGLSQKASDALNTLRDIALISPEYRTLTLGSNGPSRAWLKKELRRLLKGNDLQAAYKAINGLDTELRAQMAQEAAQPQAQPAVPPLQAKPTEQGTSELLNAQLQTDQAFQGVQSEINNAFYSVRIINNQAIPEFEQLVYQFQSITDFSKRTHEERLQLIFTLQDLISKAKQRADNIASVDGGRDDSFDNANYQLEIMLGRLIDNETQLTQVEKSASSLQPNRAPQGFLDNLAKGAQAVQAAIDDFRSKNITDIIISSPLATVIREMEKGMRFYSVSIMIRQARVAQASPSQLRALMDVTYDDNPLKGYYALALLNPERYPMDVNDDGSLTTATRQAILKWLALQDVLDRGLLQNELRTVSTQLAANHITHLPSQDLNPNNFPIAVGDDALFESVYPGQSDVLAFYDSKTGVIIVRASVIQMVKIEGPDGPNRAYLRDLIAHELSHDMMRSYGPWLTEGANEGMATLLMVARRADEITRQRASELRQAGVKDRVIATGELVTPGIIWQQAEQWILGDPANRDTYPGIVSETYAEQYQTLKSSTFGVLFDGRLTTSQRVAAVMAFYQDSASIKQTQTNSQNVRESMVSAFLTAAKTANIPINSRALAAFFSGPLFVNDEPDDQIFYSAAGQAAFQSEGGKVIHTFTLGAQNNFGDVDAVLHKSNNGSAYLLEQQIGNDLMILHSFWQVYKRGQTRQPGVFPPQEEHDVIKEFLQMMRVKYNVTLPIAANGKYKSIFEAIAGTSLGTSATPLDAHLTKYIDELSARSDTYPYAAIWREVLAEPFVGADANSTLHALHAHISKSDPDPDEIGEEVSLDLGVQGIATIRQFFENPDKLTDPAVLPIADFLGSLSVDAGHTQQLPPPVFTTPLSTDMQDALSRIAQYGKPQLYVHPSSDVLVLAAQGYIPVRTIDIANLAGANAVPSSPGRVMGDYLLRYVAGVTYEALNKGGIDLVLVRLSGDQYMYMVRPSEFAKNPLLALSQSGESDTIRKRVRLDWQTTKDVVITDELGKHKFPYQVGGVTVLQPIGVHSEEPQVSPRKMVLYKSDVQEHIIHVLHPEIGRLLPQAKSALGQTDYQLLLNLLEAKLFDDVLVADTNEMDRYISEKINIYRDVPGFIHDLHVTAEERIIRIEFLGMQKLYNSVSERAGDLFLRNRFAIVEAWKQSTGISSLRVFRRGADFFISVDQSVDIQALTASLRAALSRPVDLRTISPALSDEEISGVSGLLAMPVMPAIAAVDVTFSVDPDRTQVFPSQENINEYELAMEKLASVTRTDGIAALQAYFVAPDGTARSDRTPAEWEFLRRYYDPTDKRGLLHLVQLGATETDIAGMTGETWQPVVVTLLAGRGGGGSSQTPGTSVDTTGPAPGTSAVNQTNPVPALAAGAVLLPQGTQNQKEPVITETPAITPKPTSEPTPTKIPTPIPNPTGKPSVLGRLIRDPVSYVAGGGIYVIADEICFYIKPCRDRFRPIVLPTLERSRYFLFHVTSSLRQTELEKHYGITITSDDGRVITDEELDAIDALFAELPPSLRSSQKYGSYILIFNKFDESDFTLGHTGQLGDIHVDQFGCDYHNWTSDKPDVRCLEYIDAITHEIFHNHDIDMVQSSYCGSAHSCPALEAFVAAAAADEVEFPAADDVSLGNISGNGMYLSSRLMDYPPEEWFAYSGGFYVTESEKLKQDLPHVYQFLRDTFFNGREYNYAGQ